MKPVLARLRGGVQFAKAWLGRRSGGPRRRWLAPEGAGELAVEGEVADELAVAVGRSIFLYTALLSQRSPGIPPEKHDRSQLTVLRSHFAVQLFETVGTAGSEPATPW